MIAIHFKLYEHVYIKVIWRPLNVLVVKMANT